MPVEGQGRAGLGGDKGREREERERGDYRGGEGVKRLGGDRGGLYIRCTVFYTLGIYWIVIRGYRGKEEGRSIWEDMGD